MVYFDYPVYRVIGAVIYLIISAILLPALWRLTTHYYGRTLGMIFLVTSILGVIYVIVRELLLVH